jgi:NitT/TauT family transport system permease protein
VNQRWWSTWIAPLTGLAVLFGLWELYVRVADIRPLVLPRPSFVVDEVVDDPHFFFVQNGWPTVQEAFWGFVLALVVGGALATAMVHSRFVERASLPVIVLVQVTPVVALAPAFLAVFGFRSPWPEILTAALFCLVPFVMNTFVGLRSVDSDTLEVLESVAASRWEVQWRLRFPHALPYLFAAARVCVGLALVGAVVGEFFGGATEGLGQAIDVGFTRQFAGQAWGSIFALAFIGVMATVLLVVAERRLLRWQA